QYMLLLLPLSLLLQPPQSWKTRLRQWAAAIGVAFLSTAPLAFWNFPAFLWNVGLAQFYQVFRSNALSYAALYSAATGMQAWQFLPFIMLALAYLFIWRFGKASATAFAAAMAFALFLFVSSSQQAFCNYYFLITALLCGALAVCCNKSPDKTP
ncbi:MAG: hypothetical protein LWX83_10395, partial [Anaerolineae bacterium]|nr:hypothetical protein [Anaerolineae bacterium]